METKQAKNIAHQIDNWLQSAVFDLAEGDEAAAEEMYEDSSVLLDMASDRIFDEAGGLGNEAGMLEIARCLKGIGHPPMKKAMDEFINRHSK